MTMQTANGAGIALLAMAPSGESFLARDQSGTTWLVHPPGAGDAEVVSGEIVDEAVRQGWDRVEQTFTSWAQLDNARQVRVAATGRQGRVDVSRFDGEDVRRVLAVVDSWQRSGEVIRARRALHRLLQDATVVRADNGLFETVTRVLTELDEASSRWPVPALVRDGDDRFAKAQRRMDFSLAA